MFDWHLVSNSELNQSSINIKYINMFDGFHLFCGQEVYVNVLDTFE